MTATPVTTGVEESAEASHSTDELVSVSRSKELLHEPEDQLHAKQCADEVEAGLGGIEIQEVGSECYPSSLTQRGWQSEDKESCSETPPKAPLSDLPTLPDLPEEMKYLFEKQLNQATALSDLPANDKVTVASSSLPTDATNEEVLASSQEESPRTPPPVPLSALPPLPALDSELLKMYESQQKSSAPMESIKVPVESEYHYESSFDAIRSHMKQQQTEARIARSTIYKEGHGAVTGSSNVERKSTKQLTHASSLTTPFPKDLLKGDNSKKVPRRLMVDGEDEYLQVVDDFQSSDAILEDLIEMTMALDDKDATTTTQHFEECSLDKSDHQLLNQQEIMEYLVRIDSDRQQLVELKTDIESQLKEPIQEQQVCHEQHELYKEQVRQENDQSPLNSSSDPNDRILDSAQPLGCGSPPVKPLQSLPSVILKKHAHPQRSYSVTVHEFEKGRKEEVRGRDTTLAYRTTTLGLAPTHPVHRETSAIERKSYYEPQCISSEEAFPGIRNHDLVDEAVSAFPGVRRRISVKVEQLSYRVSSTDEQDEEGVLIASPSTENDCLNCANTAKTDYGGLYNNSIGIGDIAQIDKPGEPVLIENWDEVVGGAEGTAGEYDDEGEENENGTSFDISDLNEW